MDNLAHAHDAICRDEMDGLLSHEEAMRQHEAIEQADQDNLLALAERAWEDILGPS